jgi:hypothetical protein
VMSENSPEIPIIENVEPPEVKLMEKLKSS